MTWTQVYDPLGHWWLSALVAALPIIVLFTLLAGLRVKPHWSALAGAATAILVAMWVFHMPARLAGESFLYGVATGLMNIVWIVVAAVYLYDISVSTGDFEIMKASVGGISSDRRLQLLLVAFCFGAFIEGCAGFGSPVAIAGAFMIGLGFKPFHAAALNLIANTAPVAWGAIGTPVHMLAAVTALPEADAAGNFSGGHFICLHAVLLVESYGQQLGGYHRGAVLASLHRAVPALLEAKTHLAVRGRPGNRRRVHGKRETLHEEPSLQGLGPVPDPFSFRFSVGL